MGDGRAGFSWVRVPLRGLCRFDQSHFYPTPSCSSPILLCDHPVTRPLPSYRSFIIVSCLCLSVCLPACITRWRWSSVLYMHLFPLKRQLSVASRQSSVVVVSHQSSDSRKVGGKGPVT